MITLLTLRFHHHSIRLKVSPYITNFTWSNITRFQAAGTLTSISMNQNLPAQKIHNGDLNNTSATRIVTPPKRDPSFAYLSLALPIATDDPELRSKYRPFILSEAAQKTDWIGTLELATVTQLASQDFQLTGQRLKILVLYGSLRERYENPLHHNLGNSLTNVIIPQLLLPSSRLRDRSPPLPFRLRCAGLQSLRAPYER